MINIKILLLNIKLILSVLQLAKQVGILYHYTYIDNLLQILLSNYIKGHKNGYTYDGICFTRDAALHYKSSTVASGFKSVRLVIDGSKLSNNYKIIPRNDVIFTKYNDLKHIRGLAEEVCLVDHILNIRSYIIRIDIDKLKSLRYYNTMPNQKHIMCFNKMIDEITNYNIPIKYMDL